MYFDIRPPATADSRPGRDKFLADFLAGVTEEQ
jgi:hypothetical protein